MKLKEKLLGFIPAEYDRKGYHNRTHIEKMIERFIVDKKPESYIESTALFLAIVYHDVVYEPYSKTNEEDSIQFFKDDCFQFEIEKIYHILGGESNQSEVQIQINDLIIEKVSELIMATKDRVFKNELEKTMIEYDLSFLLSDDIGELYNINVGIFKEFQRAPVKEFKTVRVNFLESLKAEIFEKKLFGKNQYKAVMTANKLIDLMKVFKPKIAIYAGSFNPFHIGHLNILEKAEETFDKVIVVKAMNPDKGNSSYSIPKCLENREVVHAKVEFMTTTLSGIINDEATFTMIRGIRTNFDLIDEQNYLQILKDFKCSIPIVHILSNPELQHVSSSLIRGIDKIDSRMSEMYLPKK